MKADVADGVEPIYWSDAENAKMRALSREAWEDASKATPLAKKAYDSHVAFMERLGLL
jgi:hypothetical protein